jgi:hypothetical protein
MIEYINIQPIKVGMRVSVQHKLARDVDQTRPGGPIETRYQYLPGKVTATRVLHGRREFKVALERAHPSGQEWFWLGVVFPFGSEPQEAHAGT